MTGQELRHEVVNRLKQAKKTVEELATETGQPKKNVKQAILALQSEQILSAEGDRYFVIEEQPAPQSDLSDLEWRVVGFLQRKSGQQALVDDVAKELGRQDADAALKRLLALGIVVQEGSWYRITAQGALRIPLSKEEREALRAAEQQIDQLAGEVHGKQLEVARQLRIIRDGRLYRETHNRFEAYVDDRFERTRDWAYKLIAELEVREGLVAGKEDDSVEALLQTVTARETPHLAKLKKEPKKMQEALQKADEKAKAENRERTLDDVKEAVAALKPKPQPKENPKPAAPKQTYLVKFTGLDHDEEETENLPGFFTDFSKWLKGKSVEKAFTIKVSLKAK